jgi:hypothetical protein
MPRRLRNVVATLIAAGVLASIPALAQGQGGVPPRRGPAPAADGVSPGEVQRLFDAYVIMQAQQELQLSDEQYPKFIARMKALQSARQRGLAERGRIIQELRRLSDSTSLDETQARTQMRALADVDGRTANEVRDALNGIDQVLDLRQQLRFRIFEEQMERRKVDLLMRARQANRQRNQP